MKQRISVHYGGGDYRASCQGKRASATSDEETAARRVAEKVFGEKRFALSRDLSEHMCGHYIFFAEEIEEAPSAFDHGTHNIGEGGVCPPEHEEPPPPAPGREFLETTAGRDPEAWSRGGGSRTGLDIHYGGASIT